MFANKGMTLNKHFKRKVKQMKNNKTFKAYIFKDGFVFITAKEKHAKKHIKAHGEILRVEE